MKQLLFTLFVIAGACQAQTAAQCLQSGTWVPCSLVPTVQEAQAVNVKVSAGAGTTITNAFGSNTTAGNAILCLGMESAAAIPVVTDAQSNTYVVVKSSATAPGATIAIATNIAGGTTDTITLTATSGAAAFACHELKGAVTVGQVWDLADLEQQTATSIPFVLTQSSVPNEMVFTAAGFTTGQTVNATPNLGTSAPASGTLTVVDAGNSAVTGGSALAVFYAAHTTLTQATQFHQSVSLSGSVVATGLLVSVKPAGINLPQNTDPCANGLLTPYVVNISANTQIAAGAAGKDVYICSTAFPPQAGATNVNFVESATSGNACATSPTGMVGGATAALGANIALNGGYIRENPGHALARTATSGDAVCLFVSAATSGIVWFIQQ